MFGKKKTPTGPTLVVGCAGCEEDNGLAGKIAAAIARDGFPGTWNCRLLNTVRSVLCGAPVTVRESWSLMAVTRRVPAGSWNNALVP
ncbi:hypothetical protein DPF_2633 [Desulfoplanes formicivorans]|uniref:Uncharacterized protein n=1 Tax=Desulfoplanes formicivorans TaxID=1592317 RepID=A0A194AII4_9BACT|nr:hypothetical protein DPF_2633 [Desulfoplanes formicivorans]